MLFLFKDALYQFFSILLSDNELFGVTSLENALQAESTSHTALFNKNNVERNQENGENAQLRFYYFADEIRIFCIIARLFTSLGDR